MINFSLNKEKMKRFILPHPANNYQPPVFHKQRLAFYAASSLLVKVLSVAFVLLLPMTALMSANPYQQQARQIIFLTNKFRQEKGLAALKENSLLDKAAQAKAQDMFKYQYFNHTSPQGKKFIYWLREVHYSYQKVGENLALGFTQPKNVLAAWEKSPEHYANLVDPDFREIGVSVQEGIYQQKPTRVVVQYLATPLTKENANLLVNLSRSKIFWQQKKDKEILNFQLFLGKQVQEAKINLSHYYLNLKKVSSSPLWAGKLVLKEKRPLARPIIIANLSFWQQGQENNLLLFWQKDPGIVFASPNSSSLNNFSWKSYFFWKNFALSHYQKFFFLADNFFFFLFLFYFFSFLANAFFAWKNKKPVNLWPAASIVCLLLFFLTF